jgi:hypothetical protein
MIDEVSMVTSWVPNRTPLTLRPMSDNVETDFCGKKIVCVGNFLNLPRVAKRFSTSVLHRLIIWISCWNSIVPSHPGEDSRGEWANLSCPSEEATIVPAAMALPGSLWDRESREGKLCESR